MKRVANVNLVVLAIMLALACVVLTGLLWQAREDLSQQRHTEQERTKHYRQLVGMTTLLKGSNGTAVDYNLRSFDGGHTWVAVEYDDEWRMRIKGDAEVLYPGLVAQAQAMDRLTDRVSAGGVVNLASAEDRQLLEHVGFGVVAAKAAAR